MIVQRRSMPLLPLRDAVVYPAARVTFKVGRPFSKRSVEQSLREAEQQIVVVAQKNPAVEQPAFADLYDVGTLCSVLQVIEEPGGIYQVFLEGHSRVRIIDTLDTSACRRAIVEPFITEVSRKREIIKLRAFLESLLMDVLRSRDKVRGISQETFEEEDDEPFLDRVAERYLSFGVAEHQRVLSTVLLEKRFEMVINALKEEREIREADVRSGEEMINLPEGSPNPPSFVGYRRTVEGNQHGGDDSWPRELQPDEELLRKRILALDAPETVKEKLNEEFERYRMMPPLSAEWSVARLYIDTLLSLPWKRMSDALIDIARAEMVLERDHFGLCDVKKRILEYLAVLKLSGETKAPILCLVGPPGVGKTSIASSIARATGRQFVRTSLGGVRDEAEIRGHRRTYIGSMPGRIIQGIRKAKVRNPLFLLDEIDKLGNDYKGDPASALLEVLDPEQNHAFVDHYIDIEFDLSHVLFVATANDESAIPRPLRDRLEIIRIEGYTAYEKNNIARRFLLEKQKKLNGIIGTDIRISEKALQRLIDGYTFEAGVRELERKIAAICRHIALDQVQREKNRIVHRITEKNLEKYLGPVLYMPRKEEGTAVPGLVNGLAWTPDGGTILTIEAVRYEGKGNIRTTGSLGEVMKESVEIAVSLVRTFGRRLLGISDDLWGKSDLHVHFPEGAVPKDGPSAGIAITLAIASVMSGIPVRPGIAVTGEITLRGVILRVGGLQAKLMAAKKGGIHTVYLPRDNVPDLVKIPEEIQNGIRIIPVEQAEAVIRECLVTAGDRMGKVFFSERIAPPQ